ncbi:DUF3889 domain-containing protein [Aquibacillus rhizosphaerae]|uniref:DUF3889 domain-containing protein n=1 Tax=Aquibacillus rhizosphaerae TaxID=3051431 RepID=A0ABT7L721_9BACI|nr:DUF3889 domain-containing protein [Aquibacillus sp. LR5S19]MDL4841652.1 DUF3889 domain-containing protein [Aquibacillus sp. LR5S19]
MKKLLSSTLLCAAILTSVPYNIQSDMNSASAEDLPSYAKWGRLAVKEATEKYPKAQLIDYDHNGKIQNEKTTVEKFKLWLEKDKQEFGLSIDIEYNTKTEEIVDIKLKRTNK